LWTRAGEPLAALQGHTRGINHAAFSPDGQTLVTASGDETARLWTKDGKPMAILRGHTEAVRHAAFSPDGQTVVTVARGVIAPSDIHPRLWPLNPEGFIQRVNQIAKPCQTTAERSTTFPDEPYDDRQAAVQRCEAASARR
jgi:WD40 repeat protein